MKNRSLARRRTQSGRRRGQTRLFVLGAAFTASSVSGALATPAQAQGAPAASGTPLAGAAAAGQAAQAVTFDIPAGSIASATDQFRRITGIAVVLANDMVGTLPSPGVTGVMTPDQALQRLLAGSNVGFQFTARDSVRLDLRTSEEVTVSGRTPTVDSPKYVQTLRNTPQTVALISRATIEEQGATTLSEVMRNVPGITLQAGEGGGASNTAGDMFNMRGFNAANSLFVDGVRDDGLIARDVFNLEQVEVFMGPTGSDVGRGTAAGYVNMQTKTPHLGSALSLNAGYGSADQARLSADFNWSAPVTASGGWLSRSALRMNALWQHSGVPGRAEVELENRGVAPSVAFGLGTPTRLTFGAQIIRQDNLPDYGIPGAAWLDEPLAPATIRAPRQVDQRNYYGSPAYDYDRANQDTFTVKADHDVNRNLSIRNQTRFNHTNREAVITAIQNPAAYDASTNLVTVARQGNVRRNEVLSNQTSAVDRFSTGSLRHAASFGLEVTSEEQFAPTLINLGTRAPIDIFNPNPDDPVSGFAPTRSAAFSKGTTTTVGLYAFDSVDLNSRWQVSGGLRWEHYDTDFRSVDANGVTTADLSASDSLVSGKAGVVFHATEAANVYFSYGTTVTPPGSANFTLSAQANNVNNPMVEPQQSTNYEVGTKWDAAGGRLSLSGAVFHTRNRNVIFTVDAAAVPPVFNQDDAQEVNGVSLGAVGRVGDRIEVLANIGYLDAELQSQSLDTNGNRLTLTPRMSGSVWATYRLPMRVRVGGGVRYTDEVFINAANTIVSPGYSIVDGLVEYDVNTHLTLRLNLYNLADEKYIRNVNNNGGRYNPGTPRSAMLTTNVRF